MLQYLEAVMLAVSDASPACFPGCMKLAKPFSQQYLGEVVWVGGDMRAL